MSWELGEAEGQLNISCAPIRLLLGDNGI
jgi:hypothetical protein